MDGRLPAEQPVMYDSSAAWVEKHVDPAEAYEE
jgi:hypothetical protein